MRMLPTTDAATPTMAALATLRTELANIAASTLVPRERELLDAREALGEVQRRLNAETATANEHNPTRIRKTPAEIALIAELSRIDDEVTAARRALNAARDKAATKIADALRVALGKIEPDVLQALAMLAGLRDLLAEHDRFVHMKAIARQPMLPRVPDLALLRALIQP